MNAFEQVEILLVEDNHSDADLMMRALTKGGFQNRVHWVQDGVEALEFVQCRGAYGDRDRAELPKLVLLDLKMPRLNGLDVLSELKSHEATRRIPIVVMTSSNQSRDVSESYRLGANGYVTEPSQFTDLTDTVAQIATFWLRVNQVP